MEEWDILGFDHPYEFGAHIHVNITFTGEIRQEKLVQITMVTYLPWNMNKQIYLNIEVYGKETDTYYPELAIKKKS